MPMQNSGWTSVAQFANLRDAQLALMSLLAMGVPAEVLDQGAEVPTYTEHSLFYVWVPQELVDEAKTVLNPSAISEEELTREALESPPPDDA
jgi:hypothetical protein